MCITVTNKHPVHTGGSKVKLIIRNEKPEKEKTCEIWLESQGGDVFVKSLAPDGKVQTEVVFMSHMMKRKSAADAGNFEWDPN